MAVQLEVELHPMGDGEALLTVKGPEEAVVMAFGLIVSFMADDPNGVADEIEADVGNVSP